MINKIQLLLSANDPLNKDKISDLIVDEWNSIKQKDLLKYNELLRVRKVNFVDVED